MSRRWFTLACSLVLCGTFVATAVAQNSENQSSGRSIFNWFGRKNNDSQQQSRPSPSMKKGQGTPQWNLGTRGEQRPPDPANEQSGSLPGLGGAPLPRRNFQQPTNTGGSNPANTNGTSRTTTPSVAQRNTMPGQSSQARKGVRQLDISTPSVEQSPPTPKKPQNSVTRQSPSRRTAPHINPNDLRNELSGAFPNPVATEDPTSRTARIPESKDRASNLPALEKNDAATVPMLGAPVAQPVTEQPIDTAEKKASSVPATTALNGSQHAADSEPDNAAEAFGMPKAPRSSLSGSNFVRAPYSNAAPGPQTARGKEAFGEALQVAGGGDPNVLASNQTPVLTADIRGPKQILIGREAVYRVRLQNQSDVAAEGIVAMVRIPAGADVANTTATQGMVQQGQDAQAKGQLQWQLARLERHASETLELHIVPRENRPLELGITWTIAPVGSRAVVEVQEPKLQLEVDGPAEVHFDRPQVFKLTISNPGTGSAENVKIDLIPPGGKEDEKETVTSHPLGDLAAGASQTVEVELTAREAGKMFVNAIASAEGGLTSNASKEVFCRKPELEVDWRGPATKYAGTMATYFLRVRNPGTAPAEDVTVRASLPEGADFTSASEGQMFDTKTREVSWRVGTLRPGDDNYMELKCMLKNPGNNQLKITAATATGDLTDTKTAATNVVALADLKLNVSDPSGPVAVGSTAVYEIRIENRGASSAKDVNVVGLFSEGIEPEQAEGAMYTVTDGRVSFKTIGDLPAGRDVVLRIRAHAVQPGTHIFRAEVLCRDLEIKLAAEETTRFYTDDVSPTGGAPEKQAGRGEAFKSTVR